MKNKRQLIVGFGFFLLNQVALADLRVHEWGTFTALVGSDGIPQAGMYHEDEVLPDFVHGFGETVSASPPPSDGRNVRRCRGKGCFPDGFLESAPVTQKMETPVLYFYSDQGQDVTVNVKYPSGVISQTFPGPVETFPNRESAPTLEGGDTTFQLRVLSPMESQASLSAIPPVAEGNIYGHARAVPSNLVRAGSEFERFVFYRGLGSFRPSLDIRSQRGNMTLQTLDSMSVRAFLAHVNEEGHCQGYDLGVVTPRRRIVSDYLVSTLQDHRRPAERILSGEALKGALTGALVSEGLTLPEANAMMNTWEHGYLKVPGLRVLYLLSRSEVEMNLPLQVVPAPDELERVFVGRIEVLRDLEEEGILNQILIEREHFDPKKLGRFAEPMLRRVREVYAAQEPNAEVLELINRMIQDLASEVIGPE